ncbi:MAG: glutamate synthase large subunit [Saccharofermentanaceae bacterium]|nr:glutamate synthase large subunit [Saccharofermentanaceae bacterium]
MMMQKQGLYSPEYEHDACGIGFVVNIHGKRTHQTVKDGLKILANLAHRGGEGSDENTGDGAGMLLQIPDAFFRKVCPGENIQLPQMGDYGVGMVFLPRQSDAREKCMKVIDKAVEEEGQIVLGWRDTPVNESTIGVTAKENRPYIAQVFIGRGEKTKAGIAFDRALYVIRKKLEKRTIELSETDPRYFYFASLSTRTIVYKGMLTPEQMDAFYLDLKDLSFDSALALVHSRYSTNTFPSWERAHPYRYLIHNGEINTLRGNINAMYARSASISNKAFGDDMSKVLPIINPNGSDSAMFDNTLEFLTLSGRSLAETAMMMVPEPWIKHEQMDEDLKAFYEYNSMLMEPWDGPAALAFTDGRSIVATLDRNGLRPARYVVTEDGYVILSSEAGVLPIDESRVISKNRLRPGRMLLIDTEEGRIITNEEIKKKIATAHPYKQWVKENMIPLSDLVEEYRSSAKAPAKAAKSAKPTKAAAAKTARETSDLYEIPDIEVRQKMFGYTHEDIRKIVIPMADTGAEAIGAMGNDSPIAVLSDKPQLLYNYFKQLFAQVTNPPIDCIREDIVIMERMYLGNEGNIIEPKATDARHIALPSPILKDEELASIKSCKRKGFKSVVLPILYEAGGDGLTLEKAMDSLCKAASAAVEKGTNILILSDRDADADRSPIPALLAVSGLHQHLVRAGQRHMTSIVLESGEPREVHHFALLVGYGASAIDPYMAYATIQDEIRHQRLDKSVEEAVDNYISAARHGIVKILSKMGISAVKSYQGAQIFEALGIGEEVISKYFTSTASRIGGIGLPEIAKEVRQRMEDAYKTADTKPGLSTGGVYQWRKDGEYHMFNPKTIYQLQNAVRKGDYSLFKEYSRGLNEENERLCTIRGLLEFVPSKQPVSIYEVEPVESIVKRFKTGAMSYGSISQEAHETLAIAMNRLGGKSNTGEGGEDPKRYERMPNGDSKMSAIKQVASGRFGVTSDYLVHAKEIQIKMAQGAKPGEGGQLPAGKVYPWIAKTRHSTPGVGLISPPPHHDIYSIEDLAELIHDLKNANRFARINVKLVSEVGVGTIAAGVAKARADVVLISGYDGGTGAAPRTSIRHAGLPWELGVAEAHQTLLLNDLRSRITVEADGKLLTGRDVAIACLLGAEEFGFATGPLVALGCAMMRVCNLDTCPFGVATQNPKLRAKFEGKPEYVVNFMRFIAEELREIMAQLGFRTIDEMVGRSDMLRVNKAIKFWKSTGIDLSSILYRPQLDSTVVTHHTVSQDHKLEETLDYKVLIPLSEPALNEGRKVSLSLEIHNTDRAAGTQLGSAITRIHGEEGLPEDSIDVHFRGSAGQSFGAFIPKGLTLRLEGDANDYVGKGLSGGKIVVRKDREASFRSEENTIIGNVALYGATSGDAYISGIAGERFCVRNSGATAVVEGVGDHGCEYMTGGRVIVLGPTGRNFAAGMSGGIAYVYDSNGDFSGRCNKEMVELLPLSDPSEIEFVREKISAHVRATESTYAEHILQNFDDLIGRFVKVLPYDYAKYNEKLAEVEKQGYEGEEARMMAFELATGKGGKKNG